MREISALNITLLLDLLIHIGIRANGNFNNSTLDEELKTCILKAESLLMSILHQDNLVQEWSIELQKYFKYYKELFSDLKGATNK